jgi:hypothetical protein
MVAKSGSAGSDVVLSSGIESLFEILVLPAR